MGQQGQDSGESKWWSPKLAKIILYGVLALFIGGFAVMHFVDNKRSLSLSQLSENLRTDKVTEAEFDRDGHSVIVKLKGDDTPHTVDYPSGAEGRLYDQFYKAGVELKTEGTSILSVVGTLGEVALWVFLALFAFNALNSLQQLAKKGELDTTPVERPTTTLANVRGIDEVVARAREIVDIMSNPERYQALGARRPKGMILYGPPGTGKTLLGRAIAGEAGVPFFRVTASSLMDKWFGSSAQRIKNLYAKARSHKAAIVFVDEVDAIGGSREGRSLSGADAERNAALNQLLNELDGFDQSNVFTVVATNRLDVLDEAFTRAGRFDIQLFVCPPDIDGRAAILEEHTANIPLADDVDLRQVARETTGAVGADLEALANEAALTAGRAGADKVSAEHFGEALATIEQGPQRKGTTVNETERTITAYHEAGHALAALQLKDMDDPVRVTIVPRGQSGGHTRIAPAEDRQYVSKPQAKASLVWMMGGRAAEKIHCGPEDFTSGASGDLKQATQLAEQMVCQWGMGTYNTSIPLETWRESPHAEEVERLVEELLDQAEAAAIDLLLKHLPALREMVEQLLDQETIQGPALQRYSQARELHGDDLEEVEREYQPVRNSVRMTRGSTALGNGQMPVLTTR